jgi:asparagine synthase (glutamine-hydrolysing)
MCGICGIYGFEDKELIKKMMEAISHRGTDDSGFYVGGGISLGHRRLSIIDVKGGHQPMANEDGSIWIVYNGEIYNFKELREKLEKVGHKFSTSSDTEVIIHAYEEYGDYFVKKLRGMFAFAIWDERKKRLLLIRDRVGIKPLYYTIVGDVLLFSSEIKAILQYPEFKARVNREALDEFLSFGYVSGDNTLFEGIKKLEQGTLLLYDGRKKKIKYWELEVNESFQKSEDLIIRELRAKIEESIKAHMIADVPVGAFLSGGIDSSYIVGLMSRLMDEPLKTFSVGFGYEEYDELRYARIVAEYFGTEHQEIIVEPDPDLLPKITWHLEEPATDPALIPTYKVSELARKKVKVVLTGDGADEQFAGYNIHKIMYANRLYYKYFPKWCKNLLYLLPDRFRVARGIKFSMFSEDPQKTFYNYLNTFNREERAALYNIKINIETKGLKDIDEALRNVSVDNVIAKLMKIDCTRLLPNYFLMKVDKMTMAHALEARVPYLDYSLVEYTARIPSRLQLKNFREKYLLRKVAQGFLPREIVKRPKHGFDVPLEKWFNAGFRDIAEDILDNKKVSHDFFDRSYLKKILESKGKKGSRQLWNLMMFQEWYNIFIEA